MSSYNIGSWTDVPLSTSDEQVQAKYQTLNQGFRSNKTLDIQFRLQQLRNIFYAIKDNEELLQEALFKDFRRPYDETSILELHGILKEIDTHINKLPQWAKPHRPWTDMRVFSAKPSVTKQPYGKVLIISPWNYPYYLSVVPIVSAIAAGNVVCWKPTEIAPNSSQCLTKVLESALDPSIFQVVNGAIPEATAVLNLQWDKIMLTGSTTVGKIVAQAAAKNLTPVLLELGGKSPVLVSKTANIKVAANRIVWGKFINAGQTCVAPDYILVEPEVKQQLIDAMIATLKEFYPDLTAEHNGYAHMANARMYDRMVKLISTTQGTIAYQHGECEDKTLFLPPTLVSNVTKDDPLMVDELFGPVLPIIDCPDISTAGVQFVIDNHDCPLALYVFSGDQKQAQSIINRTRSGGAIINDTVLHVGVSQVPFGGIGNSGMGAYHGKYGFDEFSHERALLNQPFWAELLMKMRYPPYNSKKTKTMGSLVAPSAWYSRTGPVKRSFFSKLFTAKYFLLLIALIGAASLI